MKESGGAGDRYEQFNSSSSMHVVSVSHNHAQTLPPAVSRSGWAEEQRHLLSSKPNESVIGGPVRVLDPMVSVFKLCLDPSSSSGIVHPPMPPTISPGAQVRDWLLLWLSFLLLWKYMLAVSKISIGWWDFLCNIHFINASYPLPPSSTLHIFPRSYICDVFFDYYSSF